MSKKRRVSLKNDGDDMTIIEILNRAARLRLPNLGYYMRDELIKNKLLIIERGVVNLDT
jgi:hypothetical protein